MIHVVVVITEALSKPFTVIVINDALLKQLPVSEKYDPDFSDTWGVMV